MGPVDAFFNSMAGITTTRAATVAQEGNLTYLVALANSVSGSGYRHHRAVRV